jgi:excisionase family DNA binding protein
LNRVFLGEIERQEIVRFSLYQAEANKKGEATRQGPSRELGAEYRVRNRARRPAMATNDENLRLSAREIAAACDTNAGPAIPVVLTVDEAAALLRVSKETIYDWSSRGLLKGCCRKVGKHLRFFRDRLLQKVFNEGIGAYGT